MATLVTQIVESFQKLITQEIELGKAEIRAEYAGARTGFFLFLLYSGCGLFASVLLTLALINLLSTAGLADWAVYAIVGGLFAASGGIFYYMACNNAKSTTKGDPYGH